MLIAFDTTPVVDVAKALLVEDLRAAIGTIFSAVFRDRERMIRFNVDACVLMNLEAARTIEVSKIEAARIVLPRVLVLEEIKTPRE